MHVYMYIYVHMLIYICMYILLCIVWVYYRYIIKLKWKKFYKGYKYIIYHLSQYFCNIN